VVQVVQPREPSEPLAARGESAIKSAQEGLVLTEAQVVALKRPRLKRRPMASLKASIATH
jgi:hypothetical protein